MNVLAVDTCLQPGSLSLLRADDSSSVARDGLESEVVPLPPGWRSVALHEEIERLLARHNLSLADIDLYGVTAGPGAFTGVRLGLTAVKGFAEVYNKPVVLVSTLEALAAKNSDEWRVTSDKQEQPAEGSLVTCHSERHFDVVPHVTFLAAILDARRGQIFGAVYRTEKSKGTERTELRQVIAETVCSLRAFLNQVEAAGLKDVQFCLADEAILLELRAMAGTAWRSGSLVRVSPHLAGTVAQIAVARFLRGQGTTALIADANYLRASDAELFWKE
jgi:tRNA threonylcarbamoyladenosine biosynthesis protein TsaB